jgi:X-X-X-Leu-X-X-Gly heptad repeat protein
MVPVAAGAAAALDGAGAAELAAGAAVLAAGAAALVDGAAAAADDAGAELELDELEHAASRPPGTTTRPAAPARLLRTVRRLGDVSEPGTAVGPESVIVPPRRVVVAVTVGILTPSSTDPRGTYQNRSQQSAMPRTLSRSLRYRFGLAGPSLRSTKRSYVTVRGISIHCSRSKMGEPRHVPPPNNTRHARTQSLKPVEALVSEYVGSSSDLHEPDRSSRESVNTVHAPLVAAAGLVERLASADGLRRRLQPGAVAA